MSGPISTDELAEIIEEPGKAPFGGMDASSVTLVPRTVYDDGDHFVIQIDRVAKACLSFVVDARNKTMAVVDRSADAKFYLSLDDGTLRRNLGDLLENDPVVSMTDEDEFVAYVVDHLGDSPSEYGTIRLINLGVKPATAEEISEVEVGRNECALSK